MLVRRETMSIVWQRALSGRNSFDGAVDIRWGNSLDNSFSQKTNTPKENNFPAY
jgi:hypothetical protein